MIQLEEWMQRQDETDRKLIEKYETLRPKCAQEVIKELYEQNNIDGIWSVHLDDLELPFEVEDWMYTYAISLQPKGYIVEEIEEQTQAEKIGYRKVDEEFMYDDEKLKCRLQGGCWGCKFDTNEFECEYVECSRDSRKDNNNVIFVPCNE